MLLKLRFKKYILVNTIFKWNIINPIYRGLNFKLL